MLSRESRNKKKKKEKYISVLILGGAGWSTGFR
jgi:hypothetical protein